MRNKIYLYPLNIIQISDGRDLLPFIKNKLYNKINYNSLNLTKLVEDINEDYNKDIEILSSQENQIKLLLNLIDLNEV